MTSSPSLQIVPPVLKFLEELATQKANGYLKVVSNGIQWFVYLTDGKIFYVNFAIDPLDRLETYTRRVLKQHSQSFDWQTFNQWRQKISIAKLNDFYPSYDCQFVSYLVRKKQLTATDGMDIIQGITYEAFRNLLLAEDLVCEFVANDRKFPILWSINFLSLTKDCQDEIQAWQALGSGISSPYQRPFALKNRGESQRLEKIKKFLIGVDFHQLALRLDRSPLEVAQKIQPLIARDLVGLRTPKVPYHKLPHFAFAQDTAAFGLESKSTLQYRVVCVDDSPTILQRMQLFLDSSTFEIFSVLDSSEALGKIITLKPQIILLDITMPKIDGYQLCTMIRRHADFKTTPIIMVSSNGGFVDRTRAKLCGATDHLSKPFTQTSLNEMVFKYVVQ
jgi:two-component system, chemotaxis family, response regulator PixG